MATNAKAHRLDEADALTKQTQAQRIAVVRVVGVFNSRVQVAGEVAVQALVAGDELVGERQAGHQAALLEPVDGAEAAGGDDSKDLKSVARARQQVGVCCCTTDSCKTSRYLREHVRWRADLGARKKHAAGTCRQHMRRTTIFAANEPTGAPAGEEDALDGGEGNHALREG